MIEHEISPSVEIEQVYLVEAQYSTEAAERRPAVRAEHIARAARLKREGILVEVGAYSDRLSSSVLLIRAGSAEEALALARDDVYVRAGVWAEIDGATVRPGSPQRPGLVPTTPLARARQQAAETGRCAT